MNKNVLGGIVAVCLLLSALMVMYVFFSRTSSGYRIKQYQSTFSFFENRIDALEKQRDLLKESAAALDEQASVLKKRVNQIDVEIQNMRTRLARGRNDATAPLFSWRRLSFTPATGLIVIALLVFIWMLYGAARKRGEDDAASPGQEAHAPGMSAGFAPGNVREEEFPPLAEVAAPEHDDAAVEKGQADEGRRVAPGEERPAGEAAGEEKEESA